jgi:uncharacterized protein YjbJ (UPF0337 family)
MKIAGGGIMDKDQVGEWTGDSNAQVEGTLQQAKGKAQKAWGTVKDAAHDAKTQVDLEVSREREKELERERQRQEEQHTHAARKP